MLYINFERTSRAGKRAPARQRYEELAAKLPELTTAKALHAALIKQEEHSDVTLSQVRRGLTAANQQHEARKEEFGPPPYEGWRDVRRSIKKGMSRTRPDAYPALLERRRNALREKRAAEREARRPQMEARQLEKAQQIAARKAAVCVAQWAYDLCFQEEREARVAGADDGFLWYLHERRLDAGCALRAARRMRVRL